MKYKVETYKEGRAVNNTMFITLTLSEVPRIQVSRKTRERTYICLTSKPFKVTYFYGSPMYDQIKAKIDSNMLLFVFGEYLTVQTPFKYILTKKDKENGKQVPMLKQQLDPNTGKYINKILTKDTVSAFIPEQWEYKKTEIINREINKHKKHEF